MAHRVQQCEQYLCWIRTLQPALFSRGPRLTLLVQIILIVSYISRVIRDSGICSSMGENIPNRRPTTFGLDSSFDLIGGRCDAPPEPSGKFPALVLGGQWALSSSWKGWVVERRGRDELASWDWCCSNGGVYCRCCDRSNEEIPKL